jgi:hypothetical protein
LRDEAALHRHNDRIAAARDGRRAAGGLGERVKTALRPYEALVKALPLDEVVRLAAVPSPTQAAAKNELRKRDKLLKGGTGPQ